MNCLNRRSLIKSLIGILSISPFKLFGKSDNKVQKLKNDLYELRSGCSLITIENEEQFKKLNEQLKLNRTEKKAPLKNVR